MLCNRGNLRDRMYARYRALVDHGGKALDSKNYAAAQVYATRPLPRPLVTRSASSATGSPDRCCRLLLPEDQKGPVRRSEPAFELGGAEGIRTPDPLHAMEVRYQLRYSPARPEGRTANVEDLTLPRR